MDLKSAGNVWDALNDLYKNDKQLYDKFMKKHLNEINDSKPIKPKYCFCICTNVEKVSIKTSINEYKEKVCDYFIYIYHTKKIKSPILSTDFIENVNNLNFDNIYISTSKVKGESSKDMYAEAVIHTNIYKNMNNINFKNKIITRILEIIYNSERAIRNDIVINTNSFHFIDLNYIPKTTHYLNTKYFDNDMLNEQPHTNIDETDIKFLNILNEKNKKNNNKEQEKEKDQILIHDSSNDILKDIHPIKTVKNTQINKVDKTKIPKEVKSYQYTIIDRFLHIIMTFNNISYTNLETLKDGNNIYVYVSNKSDECMALHFKEKLSDNIKAYFNEALLKLTISIELLY
ncbi:conserved Plasmodium protein, unknown function [Plasmodium yoelii]|nr:conserved Plasmodium protein, unknown function [Plasmodium yoelii]CDU19291.1 conserved Plasmodium protein, unknown function [Plasmodium yoelii]VTZ79926.1 conserved Plasmodium protein, unknown function [Plasmodium yoelii]|eukprot:XP_022812594.1 conserved Plasmodium protein, unknown function [Plasmodium yoelii]